MKLTFLGAARQVTGSMYLLECEDGYTVLIDCGISMERKKNEEVPFAPFQHFEPKMVNTVLLTHAHVDHSGNIPNLYLNGYEGQIICTTATYQLTMLLLHDSALLNERKIKKIQELKRKAPGKTKHLRTEGLYTAKQAEETSEHFFTIAFNQRFKVTKGIYVTFIPTGHLLGAGNVLLEVEENGIVKKILFSGDIGRKNYPLLPDPEPVPAVDYLICETTYAGRHHTENQAPEKLLADVVFRTCVKSPGRLIIPAFSVGRTQTILYVLSRLYAEGKLPSLKIFVDSPLAIQSTRIYEHFPKLLNDEARSFLEDGDELFDFDNLVYVEDSKRSREIANYHEPCIILSSAGMMEGGRIQYHIQKNIQNPYCTIFIVGYNAEGTLGSDLMKGLREVTIKNKTYDVGANIEFTDIFSGHAGHNELVAFVEQQTPAQLKNIFLVHGELSSMELFQNVLKEKGYAVTVPNLGESYTL